MPREEKIRGKPRIKVTVHATTGPLIYAQPANPVTLAGRPRHAACRPRWVARLCAHYSDLPCSSLD